MFFQRSSLLLPIIRSLTLHARLFLHLFTYDDHAQYSRIFGESPAAMASLDVSIDCSACRLFTKKGNTFSKHRNLTGNIHNANISPHHGVFTNTPIVKHHANQRLCIIATSKQEMVASNTPEDTTF